MGSLKLPCLLTEAHSACQRPCPLLLLGFSNSPRSLQRGSQETPVFPSLGTVLSLCLLLPVCNICAGPSTTLSVSHPVHFCTSPGALTILILRCCRSPGWGGGEGLAGTESRRNEHRAGGWRQDVTDLFQGLSVYLALSPEKLVSVLVL